MPEVSVWLGRAVKCMEIGEEGEKTVRDRDAQEERTGGGFPLLEIDKVKMYGLGPGFQSLCRKNGP